MAGWFAISLVVAVVVIGAIVLAFGTALVRTPTADGASPLVRVTMIVAAVWAVGSAIGALVVVLTTLLQDDIRITVPVREFWPELPAGTALEGMTATRVSGGFRSADLVVAGLSAGARVCWALSQALWWLIPAAIAGMVAVACFQLLAGRAFAPVVARAAIVTAVAVALGGVAAQTLGDVGGSMAATEVLQWTGAGYPDVDGIDDELTAWWAKPGLEITFPFWPLAAGLGFAALGMVLRRGAALQRDTEGLV